MWSHHFQHLARLAYTIRKDTCDKTQSYILWYTLYLDAQSCLMGNDEAGWCVRAYQINATFLPSWTQLPHTEQGIGLEDHSGASAAAHDLAVYMCKQFAELSQLAVQMRTEASRGKGSVAARQQRIEDFHHTLCSGWAAKYLKVVVHKSSEAGIWLTPFVRTMLDFVSCGLHLIPNLPL
jgi:hypothetical protein